MAKRVLVTGGAGFIPSNFIHHLLAKTPYEVVSLDALTYAGNLDNLSGAMSHERLASELETFRPDQIVISTLPPEESVWHRFDVVDRARAEHSVPVTHVVSTPVGKAEPAL